MEQDEITRRNVAIAEYMELPGFHNHDFREMLAEILCYECKWEWIMTAVEKIMEESGLGFHFFPPFGRDTFVCRLGTNKNSDGKSMIEATWKAVSEYVLDLK